MKCANCRRQVRDENAVIERRVIRKGSAASGIDSWTETRVYGPTCAKRLGIKAERPTKPPKQVFAKATYWARERKRLDTVTPDLFEGMQ